MKSYVSTSRGAKPLPNMVVSYCCNTLEEGHPYYPAAGAFFVRGEGNSGMIENKAVAGFAEIVWAGTAAVEPNPQTPLTMWSRIDKHSEVLYEMLKMTHTLEEAAAAADLAWPIRDRAYDPNQEVEDTVPMIIHGDTKATISGVYDGQNTPSEQTRPWFKVIS